MISNVCKLFKKYLELENYSKGHLRKDFLSGLIVAIIAMPLGMGFAIASGVEPVKGLYTVIIAGIIVSICGGSRFQIGGPTGAFVPILLGIVMSYGFKNLLIACFLAGFLLLIMGVLKLGSLIKFIPRPVIIGFTSGIAVTIFSGQIPGFLGLTGLKKHEHFIANMQEIFSHIEKTNIYAVLIAFISLITILVVPKILKKVPGPLVGLIVSSIVAYFFLEGKVATIGSTYGQIPNHLPAFQLPELTIQSITLMLPSAFLIAMLGGIESLLSAVVADKMSGTRHNSNRELIGQGIANMVTSLFGGIPATGALARTAANIKNDAASRMSGVIHGIVVLIVLVSLAPLASVIPLAAMAPVLMIVAWNMSELHEFKAVLKIKNSDSVILLVTFLLTVFTNLTLAVEIGIVFTLLWFIKRMSEILTVTKGLPDPKDKNKVRAHMVDTSNNCPQMSIFTIEGPLFFGVGQSFERKIIENLGDSVILILRLGKMPYMDTTGEAHFENIFRIIEKRNGHVFVTGLQEQPQRILEQAGILNNIDQKKRFYHTGEAIDAALKEVNCEKCIGCRYRAFDECHKLSMTKMIS